MSVTATLTASLMLVGCGQDVHRMGVVRERLITADPGSTFGPTMIASSEVALELPFRSTADVGRWALAGGRFAGISPEGAAIESREQSVTLASPIDINAGSVDIFEVVVGGLNRQEVSLEWSTDGSDGCDECRLAVDVGDQRHGRFVTYRYELGGHPAWRGAISELRLKLEMPRSQNLVIQEIRGLSASLDSGRLSSAVARPWKVHLDSQVRDCMLAVPGVPVHFEVDVPPRGSLSFGYGLFGTTDAVVSFEVAVQRPSRPPEPIFQATPDEAGGWGEALIDLWRYDGERVKIVFDTEVVAGELDLLFGMPIWSNPVVLDQQSPERPNVVLISIDTLRSDRLSLYGYERLTSPNLEAWVERRGAAVFRQAVAPAPWTLPSHVSMFTGLDAANHGVNYSSPAPDGLVMLAELLRGAGYSTVAFTGGGFVHPQWGFAQGFDQYGYFAVDMGYENELESNVESALKWLQRNRGRQFFMFFHTYEVHNPFRPRQPFFASYSRHSAQYSVRVDHVPPSPADGFLTRRDFSLRVPGEAEPVSPVPAEFADLASDLYDAGVGYTDSVLARLLEVLDALNEVRPTVVIVTSDHGEMLGEHGLTNHACLYEENLLVPLVIALPMPSASTARSIEEQVRLTDIVPTVLELVGLPALKEADGQSLAPVLAGRSSVPDAPAFSYSPATNYGLSLRRSNGLKYIFKNHPWPSPAEPKEELFRLDRDPGELHNLVPRDPDVALVRKMARGYLESQRGRVLVRVFNRSGEAVVGHLGGGKVRPTTLKMAVPAAGGFWWDDEAAGFRLAPGEDHELWIDGTDEGSLMVDIGLDRRNGRPVSFALLPGGGKAAEEAVAVVLVDGRWIEVPASAPEVAAAVAGVVVIPEESPWGMAAPSLDGVDSALRDQLRALGYVE